MPRFLYLNPTLRARDIRKLAEWYRDGLGFEIRMLWQDPPAYAMVGRDEIRLAIAPRDADFGPASAYLHVEGVDDLYAEFLARNIAVLRPLEITDYRMKDFALCDPEGNCLTIGERVETAVPA
jgi:uncharacterized glyoxalase superfamily protein PhnB